MSEVSHVLITCHQLCEQEDIRLEDLLEIVAHGIVEPGVVEPGRNGPESWRFDFHMVHRVRRAGRLYRDLDVDWGGIALALDLLQQLEELRSENRRLRRQLSRFLAD